MAQIQNTGVISELANVAGIQVSRESVPNQIADKVVPVIDVNPKHARVLRILRQECSNSTSATVTTTPTNQDFYIHAVHLGVIKDATATSTISRITCVIGGATVNLIEIRGYTLTVQDRAVTISFPHPIKIDRNTAINLTNSTNVANSTSNCEIYYHVDEYSNS